MSTPAAQPVTATTTVVAVAPEPVKQPDPEHSPWSCSNSAGFVFGILAIILLVIGLADGVVMEAKKEYEALELIIFRIPARKIDIEISYTGVKASYTEDGVEQIPSNFTMDSLTCGNADKIEQAYLCVIVAVALLVPFVIFSCANRSFKCADSCISHMPMLLLLAVHGCMAYYEYILMAVRDEANGKNCNTVPEMILSYGMGRAWIEMWIAQGLLGIYFLVHLSNRYFKCCCYRWAAQQPVTVPPTAVVVADPYGQQAAAGAVVMQQQQQPSQQGTEMVAEIKDEDPAASKPVPQ